MNSWRKRSSDDEGEDQPAYSRAKMSDDNDSADPALDIDNSGTVITKIANLYAERLMSDVTLIVGDAEFPSHRLILCASSDVFQVMLMNQNWSESQEKRIVLREAPACAAVFEDFLRYLYTGKIQLDYATVIPLVGLADKYNVGDLLKLGLDFMARNVSTACKKNQIVSWFQFALGSGHHSLSNQCRDFIKWNFEVVSRTIDFASMEPELLVSLLQCSDVVIQDEFKMFECIYDWLHCKQAEMIDRGEENVALLTDHYVHQLLRHVRFPMMSPCQLADLILFKPISKSSTDLLLDKIRLGLSFHKGHLDFKQISREDRIIFTPRLYTAEKFCASLSIDHIHNLLAYHCRSLLFMSQKYAAEHEGDDHTEWFVDVYPKGVWFQRCLTVYRPPGLEVPERVLKTVRVTVSTKKETEQRVRIGVLLVGDQDQFEHIRLVKTRNYIFSRDDQIVNFDDVIDFDEINGLQHRSHFLSGPEKTSLKLFIIITPLSKFSML